MAIYEHINECGGLPIATYQPASDLSKLAGKAIRIGTDWDEYEQDNNAFNAKLDAFLAAPGVEDVQTLVIGCWSPEVPEGVEEILQRLVAAAPRLTALHTVFFGDIIMEEQEISWIEQGDHGPLIAALPALADYTVRGGTGLSFSNLASDTLRRLTVQTGGLSSDTIRQILVGNLPNLEHLELWLGDENYGWDGNAELFSELFAGGLFPRLRSLGLANAAISDDIAVALQDAELLARLEVLDLSRGTLSDVGGKALVANPVIATLGQLNLRHHYVSESVMADLLKLGPTVDLSDQQTEDKYGRFCEVSE